MKRVYLPILVGLVTNTWIRAPARSERCSRPKRTRPVRVERARTIALDARRGQPRPLQSASTRAPRGARTDRTRMRAPVRVSRPAMRTIGNGLSSRGHARGAGGPSVLKPVPTGRGVSALTRVAGSPVADGCCWPVALAGTVIVDPGAIVAVVPGAGAVTVGAAGTVIEVPTPGSVSIGGTCASTLTAPALATPSSPAVAPSSALDLRLRPAPLPFAQLKGTPFRGGPPG